MKKIKLWRVTFDVTIESIPLPRTQTAYAVGTEDLNALIAFIKSTVLQTEAQVQVSHAHDEIGGTEHSVENRPIVGFDLRGIEDLKFDIEFIDFDSLKAAGVFVIHEEEESS